MPFKKYLTAKAIPNAAQILLFLVITGLIISCSREEATRFELVEKEKSGITFSNNLKNTPEFNILNYLYFYDGGGVSIGDINDDGLADIYFTANMGPNRLYLNKGGFNFEDITDKAGVSGSADWTTGTTMADVNGDGLLDIYVSSVNFLNKSGRNQLFINNGDTTFTDKAEDYGLDFKGFAKQASFFDYDNDGDLDMYLLNHSVHTGESFTKAEKRTTYSEKAGDKLYRNENGTFRDVTKEAGIYSSILGYGLASTVSDLNNDGCQDIYVSNDFHENDYLYLNNCDGTFREVIELSTGHTSRASMGTDIADFNNDGLADIFVLDMLPYDEKIRKSAVSSEPYQAYNIQRRFGYHPQLIRNTLQLNLGVNEKGLPLFSDIAQLSGVHATDWSWSSLFFDMNNDGKKDLFVSNGIYRRPNDMDYLIFIRSEQVQDVMERGMSDTTMSFIKRMPKVKIPNFGYLNKGNFNFEEESNSGLNLSSYSNGSAYGDLDNDGDLDLVVNNVNMEAFVYKNTTREKEGGNFLKIRLKGNSKNTFGIGARVSVYSDNNRQYYEMMPTRGFLSSVEPNILVGLDTLNLVDSLRVTWPDGKEQILRNVETNQKIEINQSDAGDPNSRSGNYSNAVFKNVTEQYGITFDHRENSFNDFDYQPLAPYMLSTQGPPLAVSDVNNDGLEDFYIGGAKNQSGALYIQQESGAFQQTNIDIFEADEGYEDVDAVFFDANNDSFVDLFVVSGGNEFTPQSSQYSDRLYLNDGNGQFIKISDALPKLYENGAVAAPADFDGDGDMDLFIGNRSVPYSYGQSPPSYLLENDGNGKFRDVTTELSDNLQNIGMVTDAVWSDVNGDEEPDLIIAGSWMPISVFVNQNGKLTERTKASGLSNSNGFWNTLETADLDNDGDLDILAGNLGLNSIHKASQKEPLKLYLKDFNEDGQIDPVIAYHDNGNEYPVATRDELLTHFKYLRSRYKTYLDFAGQTMQQIFQEQLENDIVVKEVFNLSSSYLENKGDGSFTISELPRKSQFAPIFAFSSHDFTDNGLTDVLAGGNFNEAKPYLGGRYDASYGWFLKAEGDSNFYVEDLIKSGFVINGEIRDLKMIQTKNDNYLILVARNNDSLLIFERNR